LDNDSGRSVYSASKASLISLSSTLSKELAAFKIRVNTIAPGLTETDMMKNNTKKEYIEQALTHISLKRIGKPEEIANVVFFLCSDLSSYVNGQTIRVDGGMH
jgi:3-oxoacyl-[acyl-carrier protein] reductase